MQPEDQQQPTDETATAPGIMRMGEPLGETLANEPPLESSGARLFGQPFEYDAPFANVGSNVPRDDKSVATGPDEAS